MSESDRPIPHAVHGATQPRFGEIRIRNRGRLPHWDRDSGLYFLTFRLADSLPKNVLDRIVERNRTLAFAKAANAALTPEQEVLVSDYSAEKVEEYADRGAGECILRTPPIASALADALRHGHGLRYRLLTWCIMPNHVHVVVRLLPGSQLGAIVKSWKLHSARTANQVLNRKGQIWQREYYDRLIRKEGELVRAISYVLSNPQRAGLEDWPWLWSATEFNS